MKAYEVFHRQDCACMADSLRAKLDVPRTRPRYYKEAGFDPSTRKASTN